MQSSRHTPDALRIIALSLCLALLTPSVAPAAPTNAKIEATRKKATAARERLDDLSAELEERTEDYLEVAAELDDTRARIRSTERDLEQAGRDLDAAEALLNRRATAIYRSGRLDLLSVLIGSSDFSDMVARLDLMRRVGRTDAAIVSSVKSARAKIATAKVTLENRRAEQVVLRDRAAAKRSAVDEALRQQKAYLGSLDADLKRLIAEESERQAKLAAEAAARAAAAGAGRGDPSRPFDPAALGEPHPQVVDIARRYVGKTPYVWGGTTPNGFDCSGLVQYCYREIGISVPRTSRTQYRHGSYIPPDRMDALKPGDLVFFGRGGDPNRVHHVGIYAGSGQFIHAPQTGSYVSVSSLIERIQTRGDYVGATRP